MDYAMDNRVVMASPINLYAVLSLVRQSIKSFAMSEKASEIIQLLGKFRIQWDKYIDVQTKMGNSLAQATKHYDDMVGTRTRKLEGALAKVGAIEGGEVLQIEPADDVGINE